MPLAGVVVGAARSADARCVTSTLADKLWDAAHNVMRRPGRCRLARRAGT